MRFTFTLKEARDLGISALILGFLFSLNNLNTVLPITLIVGATFLIHELSHKFVAEHFDCKAVYELWPKGILASIVIAFISRGNFVFAAIGFVSISTYYSTRLGFRFVNLTLEEMGKISMAGPVSNIIMGIISIMLAPYYPVMNYCAMLNFQLALFNLIPFPPLDGSKILMWSRMMYIALIIGTLIVYGLAFLINPLIAGIIGLIVTVMFLFWGFFKEL